jgi:hypothetical protein
MPVNPKNTENLLVALQELDMALESYTTGPGTVKYSFRKRDYGPKDQIEIYDHYGVLSQRGGATYRVNGDRWNGYHVIVGKLENGTHYKVFPGIQAAFKWLASYDAANEIKQ